MKDRLIGMGCRITGLPLMREVSHHHGMDLIRFIIETGIACARDVLINLSGRIAEEFVGRRLKARRRKRRRKSAPKSRSVIPNIFGSYSRLLNRAPYHTRPNLWLWIPSIPKSVSVR
jgi:hypothetical protein